jgi:hypothetical protein
VEGTTPEAAAAAAPILEDKTPANAVAESAAVGNTAVGNTRAQSVVADGTTLVEDSSRQAVKPTPSKSAMESTPLYLVNNTNTKLTFEMSDNPDTGWKVVSLDKGASMTDATLRYIRIKTVGGGSSTIRMYDLGPAPRRYSLLWNAKHNCWDVWREQTPRQQTPRQQTPRQQTPRQQTPAQQG